MTKQFASHNPTGSNMRIMAYVMITEELYDKDYVYKYCMGFDKSRMPKAYKNDETYKDYIIQALKILSQQQETTQWYSDITGIVVAFGKWMTTWFTSNLGDAMLAGEALDHIKALFLSAYEGVEDSKEMALFMRHESEGRLHCEVKLYFSPPAADVAKAVGAIACRKPASEGLSLLAGSNESWSVFFPC